MFSLLRDDIISLNRYILYMLNRVGDTGQRTTTVRQPMVIVLVAIALVAVVGGYIFISNYVMPNIHQVCQTRLGALHCHAVQYHKIF
jgi:poly-beta-hydroxyalkanoate depolymerase